MIYLKIKPDFIDKEIIDFDGLFSLFDMVNYRYSYDVSINTEFIETIKVVKHFYITFKHFKKLKNNPNFINVFYRIIQYSYIYSSKIFLLNKDNEPELFSQEELNMITALYSTQNKL
jgi:hypothetical protein